ncbi:hypothetical protein [Marinobacter salsuginis]|uniref:hypothetical protein n=1 Tax=Marinobacter salsuginis TaxID=418719 RepID=UPI00273FFE00|nr:hypothetical protein [Marinobacter salsuginis]
MSFLPASRERTGGLAGILAGLTFLFGMVFYLAFLTQIQFGNLSADITSQLIYLQEHSSFLYTWYFVIYLVFGFALLTMQFGLSALLPGTALSRAAALVAFLWVGLVIAAGLVATVGHDMVITLADVHPELAPQAFVSLHLVINGLGGGNELVGGVWLILVFCAARQRQSLPEAIQWSALVVGMAGTATALPQLSGFDAAFGLGGILWFVATGMHLAFNGAGHTS